VPWLRIAGARRPTATASRAHPARSLMRQRCIPRSSRTRPPEVPADPRQSPQHRPRKTCSSSESPPMPAQPAGAKTGLSRRRWRVRVPSLPLLRHLQGDLRLAASNAPRRGNASEFTQREPPTSSRRNAGRLTGRIVVPWPGILAPVVRLEHAEALNSPTKPSRGHATLGTMKK
jgi:hypothetical protein